MARRAKLTALSVDPERPEPTLRELFRRSNRRISMALHSAARKRSRGSGKPLGRRTLTCFIRTSCWVCGKAGFPLGIRSEGSTTQSLIGAPARGTRNPAAVAGFSICWRFSSAKKISKSNTTGNLARLTPPVNGKIFYYIYQVVVGRPAYYQIFPLRPKPMLGICSDFKDNTVLPNPRAVRSRPALLGRLLLFRRPTPCPLILRPPKKPPNPAQPHGPPGGNWDILGHDWDFSETDELTELQLRAIELTMQGHSDLAYRPGTSIWTAKLSGDGKPSIDDYRRVLANARIQLYAAATDRYQVLLGRATSILAKFLEDPAEQNRFRAALAFLNMAGCFRPLSPNFFPPTPPLANPPPLLPPKMG